MDEGRTPPDDPERDEFWRDFLTRGDPRERRVRRIFKMIPTAPRCQLCAAPFVGPGAPLMRVLGKRPSPKNPRVCGSCFDAMERHHGGAEIEASFLFADIRGSTTLAEQMPAREFRRLLDRFYRVASGAAREAAIDIAGLEARTLALKGKRQPTQVVVLRPEVGAPTH